MNLTNAGPSILLLWLVVLVPVVVVDIVLLCSVSLVVSQPKLSHGDIGLLNLLCLASFRNEHHLEVRLPGGWSSLPWPSQIWKNTVSHLVSLGSIISWGNGLEASEAALFSPAGWRNSDWSSSEWDSAEEVAA